MTADLVGSSLIAELAGQLGSAREARWILEHTGSDGWQDLVRRRAAGEPLQYVLGTWPFRTLELAVDRRVLIPRPETEQVVEVALAELGRMRSLEGAGSPPPGRARCCVDLGTGSGAIALSLAAEGEAVAGEIEVWATDDSQAALAVARHNLGTFAGHLSRTVQLAEGSWFEALPDSLAGQIDLLVSNPPYVPEGSFDSLDPEVRDWEPRHALVAAPGRGGVAGMAAIETVVEGAADWLGPAGRMVIELDPSQAGAAVTVARAAGFGRASVVADLSGRDRMLVAGR